MSAVAATWSGHGGGVAGSVFCNPGTQAPSNPGCCSAGIESGFSSAATLPGSKWGLLGFVARLHRFTSEPTPVAVTSWNPGK